MLANMLSISTSLSSMESTLFLSESTDSFSSSFSSSEESTKFAKDKVFFLKFSFLTGNFLEPFFSSYYPKEFLNILFSPFFLLCLMNIPAFFVLTI